MNGHEVRRVEPCYRGDDGHTATSTFVRGTIALSLFVHRGLCRPVNLTRYAQALGRLGGQARTEAQNRARAANGQRGGRPPSRRGVTATGGRRGR
jgi:hypothetical protein